MTDNRGTCIAEANVKLDDAISPLEKAAARRTWAIPLRHTSLPRCCTCRKLSQSFAAIF